MLRSIPRATSSPRRSTRWVSSIARTATTGWRLRADTGGPAATATIPAPISIFLPACWDRRHHEAIAALRLPPPLASRPPARRRAAHGHGLEEGRGTHIHRPPTGATMFTPEELFWVSAILLV